MGKKNDIVSVGVIGGGVAGLTVAHELGEKGFDVTVYERSHDFGGRVKTTTDTRGQLREHSLKNFTAYYYCLFETLKRIPVDEEKTVFDNLKPYKVFEFQIETQKGHSKTERYQLNTSTSRSVKDKLREAEILTRWLMSHGLSRWTVYSFLWKHLRLMWMSDQRRRRELSHMKYRDYLGEGQLLELMTNLIEITAAADVDGPADVAALHSLKIYGRFAPHHKEMTNSAVVMSGPQTHAWFVHWAKLLREFGCKFATETEIESLTYDAKENRVTGARTSDGRELNHDIYVIAVPINRFKLLIQNSAPELQAHFPTLPPFAIEKNEKWAHNLHVMLKEKPSNNPRINLSGKGTAVLSSPWSIVYVVFSDTLWDSYPVFKENAPAMVMFTFSNSTRPGLLHKKPYPLCTPQEIFEEVMEQCDLMDKDTVHSYYLGDGLDHVKVSERDQDPGARYSYLPDGTCLRAEGLLATRGLGEEDLSQRTAVRNLYLAGEFTKCIQEVATMEKANEAGKRAAAYIFREHGIAYPISKYRHHDRPYAWLRYVDAMCGGNGWKYLWPIPVMLLVFILPFVLPIVLFIMCCTTADMERK